LNLNSLGSDTRAKRFESFFTQHNVTVFEVDKQPIQERKKKITNNLNWNVKFVVTDFNTDNLLKSLINNGYNPNLKTIFLLEGSIIK